MFLDNLLGDDPTDMHEDEPLVDDDLVADIQLLVPLGQDVAEEQHDPDIVYDVIEEQQCDDDTVHDTVQEQQQQQQECDDDLFALDVEDDDYETTVKNIVEAHRVDGAHWTHTVCEAPPGAGDDQTEDTKSLVPFGASCVLTEAADAVPFYLRVQPALGKHLVIHERRIGAFVRLSFEITVQSDQVDVGVLCGWLAALTKAVADDLLEENAHKSHTVALVIGPQSMAQALVQPGYLWHMPTPAERRFIVHYPCTVLPTHMPTEKWIAQQQSFSTAGLEKLTVRGHRQHVPMYGAEGWSVVGVYHNQMLYGTRRWVSWVTEQTGPGGLLADRLYVGGHRKDALPGPVTAAMLLRVLPLLCSINPMGTPLTPWREMRQEVQTFPDLVEQYHKDLTLDLDLNYAWMVSNALEAMDRAAQIEVGRALWALSRGEQWGYVVWSTFVNPKRNDGAAVAANALQYMTEELELRRLWTDFRNMRDTVDARLVLDSLLMRRLDKPKYDSLMNKLREADHIARVVVCPDARMLGSLTHMDLARFLWHELHCYIRCVDDTNGMGSWYVYDKEAHRWAYDCGAAEVRKLVYSSLCKKREEFRKDDQLGYKEVTRTPMSVLMNFQSGVDEGVIRSAVLVQLDVVAGDWRQVRSVLAALGSLVIDHGFTEKLDTTHDHLVPFTNGVLDLDARCLRPGRPEDYLSRGPGYHWVDYAADDPTLEMMEDMMCRFFPDRVVLGFVSELIATFLRRRNRFKQFLIFTGNTNGGKSLFLDLLQLALGPMFGTLPVQAITSRPLEASTQTDYLARTQGMAVCVCNEPDLRGQVVMTDQVKSMTSDTDKLPVRRMFGPAKEMRITWKLVMACNTPPNFSNVDDAVLWRTVYVPFLSTFVPEEEAPRTQEGQFAARRFPARRQFLKGEQQALAERLMFLMYARFVRCGMHLHTYSLHVPLRMRLETRARVTDCRVLDNWLRAHVWPWSAWSNAPHPYRRADDCIIRAVCDEIRGAIRVYEAEHPDHSNVPWRSLDPAVRMDTATPGSPGWVRCQCINLAWFTLCASDMQFVDAADAHMNIRIPFVTCELIVDSYNHFRYTERTVMHAPMPNPINTARRTPAAATAEDPHAGEGGGGRRFNTVGLHTRAKLDDMYVLNTIMRVVQEEPNPAVFFGTGIITPQHPVGYTDTQNVWHNGSTMLWRAVSHNWYERYAVPLVHHRLVPLGASVNMNLPVFETGVSPLPLVHDPAAPLATMWKPEWLGASRGVPVPNHEKVHPILASGSMTESAHDLDTAVDVDVASAAQSIDGIVDTYPAWACLYHHTPNVPDNIVARQAATMWPTFDSVWRLPAVCDEKAACARYQKLETDERSSARMADESSRLSRVIPHWAQVQDISAMLPQGTTYEDTVMRDSAAQEQMLRFYIGNTQSC